MLPQAVRQPPNAGQPLKTHHPLKKIHLAVLLGGVLASQPALAIKTYEGDPGTLGNAASWRTPEFLRDWGLRAIGAEFAYAAGFSGDGVRVGMVDSGYFDLHPQLGSTRYQGVTVNGVAGSYNPAFNDTHGTHVGGTIAAGRDGSIGGTNNFHGVAFNANVVVGNTGKTDAVLFGMPQASQTAAQTIDNAYVADVYRAVNASGARVINTSFGSQPNSEQYQTLLPSASFPGRVGLLGAWGYLSGSTGTSTWFQGAVDAARTGTLMVFSAGNTGYANASTRAAAAYFDPTLEAHWLGVAAISATGQTLNADGSINIPGRQLYNQCGVAKWSCMTAPGNAINGSTVTLSAGVPTASYSSFSGTSMAAPHASGALAVLMERYAYMNNAQVLEVMKTTAIQNQQINDAAGVAITNPNAGQRVVVPDERNGWGTVSLRHAMNGPGQFTGRFAVDTQGQNDSWSNSISDTAIRARQGEDQAEAVVWAARVAEMGWQNGLPAGATPEARTEFEVGTARAAARDTRVYAGSLAKLGAGTLTLSGSNSYTGGTQVYAGGLVAASATALGSGDVEVLGGSLAVRSVQTLMLGGDLSLAAAAELDLVLGSDGAALIDLSGAVNFGGALSLSFAEGFVFNGTQQYALIDYGSHDGSFAATSFTGLIDGYSAELLYTATGLELNVVAVPEPATYALMFGGLGLVGWMARRRRRG